MTDTPRPTGHVESNLMQRSCLGGPDSVVSRQHDSPPAAQPPAGPDRGFGRLWRKRYSVPLPGIAMSPDALIANWKEHFGDFWPGKNTFYAPIRGLQPGEVAGVQLEMPGGAAMSTGVRLVYSEPSSFSLAAPQGHVFCGWTTFSARPAGDGLVAEVEVLMRGSDPLFEVGLELFGHKREDEFWLGVLKNLATHHGCVAEPTLQRSCIDKRYLARNAGNIRANSVLRNGIHRATGPFRSLTTRRGNSIQTNPESNK
jgi:hypothetical protein